MVPRVSWSGWGDAGKPYMLRVEMHTAMAVRGISMPGTVTALSKF
jgi:hypothetical protein